MSSKSSSWLFSFCSLGWSLPLIVIIIRIVATKIFAFYFCETGPKFAFQNACEKWDWTSILYWHMKCIFAMERHMKCHMSYEMYHRPHCCDKNLCSSLLIWADPIYSSLPGALLLRMDSFYFTLSSSKSWSWWWSSSSSKSWSWSMIIIEIMTKQLIFRQLLVGCNFVWSSSIKKTIKRSKWRPAPQKLEKVLKS